MVRVFQTRNNKEICSVLAFKRSGFEVQISLSVCLLYLVQKGMGRRILKQSFWFTLQVLWERLVLRSPHCVPATGAVDVRLSSKLHQRRTHPRSVLLTYNNQHHRKYSLPFFLFFCFSVLFCFLGFLGFVLFLAWNEIKGKFIAKRRTFIYLLI